MFGESWGISREDTTSCVRKCWLLTASFLPGLASAGEEQDSRKESALSSILTGCPWKLWRCWWACSAFLFPEKRLLLTSLTAGIGRVALSPSRAGGAVGKPAPPGRSRQLGSPVGSGPSDTQGGARLLGEKQLVPESVGVPQGWPILHLAFYRGGGSVGDPPPPCPPATQGMPVLPGVGPCRT